MNRTVFSCLALAVFLTNLWAQPTVVPVSRLNYWGSLEQVAVAGDYAFASNSWGVMSFDISNPAEPVMLDHIPIGNIISFEIHGNILNVGARLFTRIDISDPENLRLLPELGANFTAVSAQAGNIVYGFNRNWLYLSDVSEPEEPAVIDSVELNFWVIQMKIEGNLLICQSATQDLIFHFISIENPNDPELLGEFRHEQAANRGSWSTPFYIINNQFYIMTDDYSDGFEDPYLSCIDFNDPTDPILRWELLINRSFISGIIEDMLVVNVVEEDGYPAVFYSTDDPDTLIEVGRYEQSLYNLHKSGNLLFSGGNGLYIFNANNLENIEQVGEFNSVTLMKNLIKIDNNLFFGTADGTINVVNVEDTNYPSEVAVFEGENWMDVYTDWHSPDNSIFIIAQSSSLSFIVLQFENEQLDRLSELDMTPEDMNLTEGWIRDIDDWIGGLVVTSTVIDRENRRYLDILSIVSLENPQQPEIIGTHLRDIDFDDRHSQSPQVLVMDNLVYLPNGGSFMGEESFIYSIENPTQPELLASESSQREGYPLTIDNQIMISGNDIFSLVDPVNPEQLGTYENREDFRSNSVSLQHGLLAISSWNMFNFRLYNINAPQNPITITEQNLPEYPTRVILDEGFIYMIGQSGIEIMQYTGADGVNDPLPNQPISFELSEPYPNPFNSTTLMSYTLPQSAEVQLSLYDTAGRLVNKLIVENLSAGSYQYTLDGNNLSAGVYLLQFEAGEKVQTKKIVLLK